SKRSPGACGGCAPAQRRRPPRRRHPPSRLSWHLAGLMRCRPSTKVPEMSHRLWRPWSPVYQTSAESKSRWTPASRRPCAPCARPPCR
ncbi:unnamed protein product, partial [Effrenium voratum]